MNWAYMFEAALIVLFAGVSVAALLITGHCIEQKCKCIKELIKKAHRKQ